MPAELLLEILEYLSVEDLISFTFCRWDFFQASVGFFKGKIGPSIQNVDALVCLFNEKYWPKHWLQAIVQNSARSEQSILQDIDILIQLFETTGWPEKEFRDIVHLCASFKLPILHSCLDCGFHEVARLSLQRSARAIFDTNNLKMSTLHISILARATEIVNVLEVILRDMPESNRIEYVNQLDEVGHTALAYAITSSSIAFIDTLIRAGADVDRRDRLGYTSLMDACHLGRDKVIDCLVDYGADVTATNNFNQSILEHIMMGESQKKHAHLRRLCPRTSQEQLNRAL